MEKSLNIWLVSDGKPGHKNQLVGLVNNLKKRVPVSETWLPAMPWYKACSDGGKLPKPDVILCCGHRTHLTALLCKWRYGGLLCVLMKPSLPLVLFDLCVIPAHDQPPSRPNVVQTLGVLNTIEPSQEQQPDRGLILIGGPSKHHHWNDASMGQQVVELCKQQPNIHWTLTTSRRTPESFLESLRQDQPQNLSLHPFHETHPAWLSDQFKQASVIWVSEDSVSMVYESLSSGAATGLLSVPAKASQSRVIKGLEAIRDKIFPNATQDHLPLQEAQRVADILLQHLAR